MSLHERLLHLFLGGLLLAGIGAAFQACGSSSGGSSGAAPTTGPGGGTSGGGGTTGGAGSQGASGSLAGDYLRDATYTSLQVEVDYVGSTPPTQAALDLLRTRLGERCRKPAGITITLDESLNSSRTTWSQSDIEAFEATHRDRYSQGSEAVLYVLYLNGGSDQDNGSSRVLGLSYSGSSFCIFKESVDASATLALTSQTIEEAVLVHEAGHNLGLVNNGTPMQTPHQDTANGNHDTDSSCVMHHTIESSLISQLLGVPNQFGANCVADLQAAGGQ